jgi:hypothetical protein
MQYADSKSFFEISYDIQLENSLHARALCLKDFLKRCAVFPFALLLKAWKSLFRLLGVGLGAVMVLITLGSSVRACEFFIDRVLSFAKDLADWLLLPFALLGCFLRLVMALLIHPNFYFNAL